MAYESKYTGAEVESLLEKAEGMDLSGYLTAAAAEETYQGKLAYVSEAAASARLNIGGELADLVDIEPSTYGVVQVGTVTFLQSSEFAGRPTVRGVGTVAVMDDMPDLSGYLTAAAAEETYQGKLEHYDEGENVGAVLYGDSEQTKVAVGIGTISIEARSGLTVRAAGGAVDVVAEDGGATLNGAALRGGVGLVWIGTGMTDVSGVTDRGYLYPSSGTPAEGDCALQFLGTCVTLCRVTAVSGSEVSYRQVDDIFAAG